MRYISNSIEVSAFDLHLSSRSQAARHAPQILVCTVDQQMKSGMYFLPCYADLASECHCCLHSLRESPMGNAKLHRILRFRMGSHHLPVEEGRHFNLPRASRVCNLCNTDALGDERHMLLECPALAALRLQFSSLLLPCSGVMRRLLWAKDQHEVCRYIIACLDRMSSH